jgi:hypothetical protein
MKDLCTRSRAVMNLLLLISMLQVWILVSEDHSSVVENTRKLCDDLMLMQSMTQASGTAEAFVAEYENTLIGGTRWNVQKIKLSTVLAITTIDFDNAFPNQKSILDIASRSHRPESEVSKMVADIHDRDTAILDGLRATIEHAHLPPETSTIYDLERLSAKEIDLPYVHAPVDVRNAFWILAIGSLLVITMLYSLVDSIWRVGTETNEWGGRERVLDVALLYPSKWAFYLAAIWIGSPPLLVAVGSIGPLKVAVSNGESWTLRGLACLMVVIVLMIIFWRVRRIRAHMWGHKKAPEGHQGP